MPHTAHSAFTVDPQTPQEVDWPSGSMTRMRFIKQFTGDLTGSSVVEATLLRADHDGPAIYVGIERFDCTVAGRAGTFLLVHSVISYRDGQGGGWTVAPGSGTAELIGLTGTAEILPDHHFDLTYELPEQPR